MNTTAHKPYVKYESGEVLAVFGFREKSTGTKPLVSNGQGLVLAENYKDEPYEIFEADAKISSSKEVLHG